MEIKISKVLSRIMKERKLSIKELSEMSGVPTSTLHEWQNGRSPRDPVKAKKLAEALNLTLDQLLFDEQVKAEPLQIEQIIKEDFVSGTFEVTIKRVKDKR